jgi:hypothetical protein
MDMIQVEFVGGPEDGRTITIDIPPLLNSAPEVIKMPVMNDPDAVVAGQPSVDEYTFHLYRSPAGDEELEAANTAIAAGESVKYRYAGQEQPS